MPDNVSTFLNGAMKNMNATTEQMLERITVRRRLTSSNKKKIRNNRPMERSVLQKVRILVESFSLYCQSI